nr:hypothetical protein [Nitrincola sp. A-D6]
MGKLIESMAVVVFGYSCKPLSTLQTKKIGVGVQLAKLSLCQPGGLTLRGDGQGLKQAPTKHRLSLINVQVFCGKLRLSHLTA